ncbi:hypothetical protein [Streptomyces sp. NPDC047130]|uniref:hypothetical protein n=1 Tax=Streptomyces sp. NPDC047130 TaxID=3155261 RepID=UPI003411D7B8
MDGVVTMDLHENLQGIERQIEQVRQALAPDEPGDQDEGVEVSLAVTWLVPGRGATGSAEPHWSGRRCTASSITCFP